MWPNVSYCVHLGNESVDELYLSLHLLTSLCYFILQINISITDNNDDNNAIKINDVLKNPAESLFEILNVYGHLCEIISFDKK